MISANGEHEKFYYEKLEQARYAGKAGSASKVKLNSFNDLFGGAENAAGGQIIHARLRFP